MSINNLHSIAIHSNNTAISDEIVKSLKIKLQNEGFDIETEPSTNTKLLICVGGDGSVLSALHKYNFPQITVVGINTGNLGFFQEIEYNKLNDFIYNYKEGRYSLQSLSMVDATIRLQNGEIKTFRALNEIMVRSYNYYTAHLNLSIDGSFIEKFIGDGLLIATSAGSTAYNYSLGGSIVDPRLNLLQVTPIAPMNTTAYRSFTSSILLPSELTLEISPDITRTSDLTITYDGISETFSKVKSIDIRVSKDRVNLMRLDSYDFWNKVKSKFL